MEKEQLIQLINFLKRIEYRIERQENNITVWIDFAELREFNEIFGYDYFYEGGIEATLLYDSIALNLYDFLDGIADDEDLKIIRKQLGDE